MIFAWYIIPYVYSCRGRIATVAVTKESAYLVEAEVGANSSQQVWLIASNVTPGFAGVQPPSSHEECCGQNKAWQGVEYKHIAFTSETPLQRAFFQLSCLTSRVTVCEVMSCNLSKPGKNPFSWLISTALSIRRFTDSKQPLKKASDIIETHKIALLYLLWLEVEVYRYTLHVASKIWPELFQFRTCKVT